jgi:TonB-linked SusC/RagA family outer membrane protein
MRLSFYIIVLLFGISISVFGRSYNQEDKLVTINGKYSISQIFKKIEEQTGKQVFYINTLLNDKKLLDVRMKNSTIEAVMRTVLDGTGLEFDNKIKTILVHLPNKIVSSNFFQDSLITVRGRVTDEKGDPIPGASIVINGSKAGTTSLIDGSFILKNVNPYASLTISSVAFLTQDINIRGREMLANVVLKPFIGTLDETVVIAYGTTTQRFSAGNVNVVKGEDIQTQPVDNPLLALAGRVPGVFITQSSGISGGGVRILIQGQNSISKGNEPFYVIDGVPYTSQLLPSISGSLLGNSGVTNSQPGNPLNYINPSDIESISVLKDADATAIYGSRAANGAILITTKKGVTGQVKVNVNLQQGWGRVTREMKLLSTSQYLQMRHEAILNDGKVVEPSDYDVNGFWDTTRQTNWQKELIGKTSQYTNATIGISGGTNLSQYLVSGTYRRETTVFPGSFSDQKGALHFNLNSTSQNQRFHFQLTGNYLVDMNKLPNIDYTGNALGLAPNAPKIYNDDGSLNWMLDASGTSTWSNPLANLYIEYSNKTSNLLSNALVKYNILPGFEIRSSIGYNNLQVNEIYTAPVISQKPENRNTYQRSASYGNNMINSWIIEPQALYKRDIRRSKIEFLIGTTIQQSNSTGLQQLGIGYNSDQVLKDIRSANSIIILSNIASVYKYNALFSRFNFLYNNKYIVDINARRDGSSRFGAKNRFHNFASGAAAWIFSQESLIKENFSFLNYGKIRASYGTTGSDQIGDYEYLNLYVPYTVGEAYQGVNSIVPQGLTNPYLQWEETRKLQFGLDLGWFKERILVNINYSRNRSSNQLLQYRLPIVTGFSSIARNFPAKVGNDSWEILLNTINIKNRKINWTSSLNLTIGKNKLISFPNLESSSYAQSLIVGESVNINRVFTSAGVNPTTGYYQFYNSKGEVTANPNSQTDKNGFINRLPKYFGGFQNTFSYKGFTCDFLFQFVKQVAPVNYIGILPGGIYSNQPVSVLKRWQKENDITTIQRYSTNNNNFPALFGFIYGLQSDLAYADASYIRLKNISVSWQVPISEENKNHLSARIYLQGQNLLTITKYKGLDPENASTGNLPPLKILTLGIQASF